MATKEQKDKLMEVLKFTPRTYKIQMWGYGGEYIMGTVDRKIYDYFRARRLNLSDFAWDSDYAEDHNIPEDMWPFTPGSYYDCDNICHEHGVDRNAGTLQILDENEDVIYERRLEDISGAEDDDPQWGGGEEYWIGGQPVGTVVFYGVSNEKGTFFEGQLELKQPFDIAKLTLSYDEIDGCDIINCVEYDGEQIDNWGGDTNGKGSEFGFYLIKDSNTWEKYATMDDIEYPMTEWFPKKIKPARIGNYMIRTAGKNSYTYHAKWTGAQWVNQWCEEENYNDPKQAIKVKEWQGLAVDPDFNIDVITEAFDEEHFDESVAELERIVTELGEQVNGTKEK